jgi:methionine-rich copper-binding protein CopC
MYRGNRFPSALACRALHSFMGFAVALTASRGDAHAIAGDRVFPATLAVDDPGVRMNRDCIMTQQRSRLYGLIGSMSVVGAVVVHASSALAHVFPQTENPGAGATVDSPAQVSIHFDGPLEPSFSTLAVLDANGKRVTTEPSKVDPKQPADMSVRLPTLASGRYTVQWVAVAADGHRTHGDYPFEVK